MAITKILDQFGYDILSQKRAIGILSDYGGYCDCPSYKFIHSTLLHNAEFEELLNIIKNGILNKNEILMFISNVKSKYGFAEDIIVAFTFDLIEGCGLVIDHELAQQLESKSGTANQVEHTNIHHLKFMGIPIDGTIQSIIVKLQQKGLILTKVADHYAEMHGRFSSLDNCNIDIYASEYTNLVWMIVIQVTNSTDIATIKSQHKKLDCILRKKYGNNPVYVDENFNEYSSNNRMECLLPITGLPFNTYFESIYGTIQLEVEEMFYDVDGTIQLSLTYTDEGNSKLDNLAKQRKEFDDL